MTTTSHYVRPGMGKVSRCAMALIWISMLGTFGCGGNRSEQYRLEGDSYLNLGKTEEALERYEQAMEADPGNSLAQVGYGRCLRAQGKDEQALLVFKEVLEKSPETDAAYWEVADVLVSGDQIDEALEVAEGYASGDPEQAGRIKARILALSGDAAGAVAVLEGLREAHPNSEPVLTELGLAYVAAGENVKAEEQLRAVLRNMTPDSVPAWLGLIEAARARGASSEIATEVEQLASKRPTDDKMQTVLALAYLSDGKPSEAESVASAIARDNPNSGWANYAMGACLLREGDNAEALPYLQRAASVLPQDFLVQRDARLARRSAGGGETVRMADQGSAPTDSSVTQEDAGWRSLWKQAALEHLLDRRDEFLASDDAFVRETLVAAAVFTGKASLANEMAEGLPEDSPLRAYLAGMNSGDAQAIVDALEPWKDRTDEAGLIGRNALGYAMAVSGVRARSLTFFWTCLQQWPDNGVALYNGAQAFRLAGMHRQAAQTYSKFIALHPNNPEAYILQFLALRASDANDEARRAVEAAYAVFPNEPEIVLGLSQAYLDAKEVALAKNVLSNALKTNAEPEIRVAMATLHLQEGNSQEALSLIEGAELPAELAAKGALIKAYAGLRESKWSEAMESLNAGEPANLSPAGRMIGAAAQLKSGNPDGAAAQLTGDDGTTVFGGKAGRMILYATGKDATQPTDTNDLAFGDTLKANPDLTAEFACAMAFQMGDLHDDAYERIVALLPALGPVAPQLLPVAFDSLSRSLRTPDPSSEGLRLAEEFGDSSEAWLGVAGVLGRMGEVEKQREALDRAVEGAPENPAVYLQRGMYFERQKDMAAAEADYGKVVALAPDHPIANNNLAYCILSADGDAEKALVYARKAIEGMPNDPHVMHTVGLAELRAGLLDESKQHLEAALERMPGEPTLLMDHGMLLIKQGNVDAGRNSLQAAIAYAQVFGLDFPRQSEAEEVLSGLPKPDTQDGAAGTISTT